MIELGIARFAPIGPVNRGKNRERGFIRWEARFYGPDGLEHIRICNTPLEAFAPASKAWDGIPYDRFYIAPDRCFVQYGRA